LKSYRPKEKKGLFWLQQLALLGILAITLMGIIPANGFFRGSDGGLLTSPLIRGCGGHALYHRRSHGPCLWLYYRCLYQNDSDVVNGMAEAP
jgi:aminobenzoyl-glutamate transport protein